MQSLESRKKIVEFASQALGRMKQEDVSPVPRNFELWYVYYAQINTDVVRAIDLMVDKKQDITDELCEELYQRFLSQSNENARVKEAGEAIQDTLNEMTGRVSGIKSMAQGYSENLQQATQNLSDGNNNDPGKIKMILDSVLDNTQDMIRHNIELERELERSSEMMLELQRDLETVRKQALTDGLTNLANRKAFDDEIERIVSRCANGDKVFTLIFIDIDHFKSFNDNYGHQVGDQVLRLVAKTLIDGVKGRDTAARYGGEEFAIILPDTTLEAATKVADALRKVVQGKELINRNTGDVLGRITLSGGVAEYSAGETVDDLIQRVDAALYSAKHNGRNQIAMSKTPSQKRA